MNNQEWLDSVKKDDERYYIQDTTIRKWTNDYRQTKALEIIAEELIKLNECDCEDYEEEEE